MKNTSVTIIKPDYPSRFIRKAGLLLKPAQWVSASLAQSHNFPQVSFSVTAWQVAVP
jgi:hypothetical protein